MKIYESCRQGLAFEMRHKHAIEKVARRNRKKSFIIPLGMKPKALSLCGVLEERIEGFKSREHDRDRNPLFFCEPNIIARLFVHISKDIRLRGIYINMNCFAR